MNPVISPALRVALSACLAVAVLGGCATSAPSSLASPTSTSPDTVSDPVYNAAISVAQRVEALLPPLVRQQPSPQLLLLGEQHDAPQHQAFEREVVTYLLRHGRLGALALEMAERGKSTAELKPYATEAEVKQALGWNEAGWPWATYGPAVMLAVREDVLVLGVNLPRSKQREAMRNEALDATLNSASLQKQQQLIEDSHCGLLASTQILPMTRIQLARDQTMAQTLVQTWQQQAINPSIAPTRSGIKPVVLLLAGSGHANRELGVPQHLPPRFISKSIQLQSVGNVNTGDFDAIWPTAPMPPKDYCAAFKASVQPQTQN